MIVSSEYLRIKGEYYFMLFFYLKYVYSCQYSLKTDGMIIFGSRGTHLYSEEVSAIECSHCGQQTKHCISVFGRYAHVFWIPFFPMGKKGVSECNHCMRTLAPNEMSASLKLAYQKVSSATSTPFWYWSGLILVGVLFILPMITSLVMAIFH